VKVGIIVGLVVAVVAVAVCLIPLKEVAYAVTVDYEDTETYYEPLHYRELYSFNGGAEDYIKFRDDTSHSGYELPELPNESVLSDNWALYVLIQNLDDTVGTLQVDYTLTTADKEAAEKQSWIVQRSPEEYEELDREWYSGNVSLSLEQGEIGLAVCPPEGINIAPDRVSFDAGYQITAVREAERTVAKQRQETRYKKVTLLDYVLHY
jgi:hypothetical protein